MTRPGPGRPLGDVSRALLAAAASAPGTVRQLAERACVGYDVARRKAHALEVCGALAPLREDRPRVLALPDALDDAHDDGDGDAADAAEAFKALARSFWQLAPHDEAHGRTVGLEPAADGSQKPNGGVRGCPAKAGRETPP